MVCPVMKLNRRQKKYKKIFLKKLAEDTYMLEKNRCPCGGSMDLLLATNDHFGIPIKVVLCKLCGTMRVDPYYTDKTLRSFYDLEYRELYELNPRVSKKFFDHEVEGGEFIYKYLFNNFYKKDINNKVIFEIGCSAGGILSYFKTMKNEVHGCDYDSTYIRYGRNRGLDLKIGGIEQLEKISKKADIIILCHVLEHCRNPISVLKRAKKLLKNDGILFVAVPGIYFVHRSSDADFRNYVQSAHCFYFTLRTLTKVACMAGYKLVYGDESAFAVFTKGKDNVNFRGENYKDILKYLGYVSRHRYLLLYKGKVINYVLNLLKSIGLLNFAIGIYHLRKNTHGSHMSQKISYFS